jgi:hypothetical protein
MICVEPGSRRIVVMRPSARVSQRPKGQSASGNKAGRSGEVTNRGESSKARSRVVGEEAQVLAQPSVWQQLAAGGQDASARTTPKSRTLQELLANATGNAGP